MTALASEAGLSRGLLHYHFGSVEGLFVAAASRFFDRLLTELRSAYAEQGPPAALLASGIERPTDAELWAFIEFVALGQRQPDIGARCAAFAGAWVDVAHEAFPRIDETSADAITTLTLGAWVRRAQGHPTSHQLPHVIELLTSSDRTGRP